MSVGENLGIGFLWWRFSRFRVDERIPIVDTVLVDVRLQYSVAWKMWLYSPGVRLRFDYNVLLSFIEEEKYCEKPRQLNGHRLRGLPVRVWKAERFFNGFIACANFYPIR